MTKPNDSTNSAKSPTALHPAYSVSNIQSKIRTLDGTTVTYSLWVKLFRFQAMAYRVVDHIDDTPPPNNKNSSFAAWKELDALVSQWIYSTVSDDILTRILDTDASARTTWLKLEKIFLSNKQAKAAALETKFVNLTLAACSSVDDYCKQLKDLANQLADVDQPVTESRLVIQLVRGLSAEFDTTASLINSQKPDWDLARSMLHDEVIRQVLDSPNHRPCWSLLPPRPHLPLTLRLHIPSPTAPSHPSPTLPTIVDVAVVEINKVVGGETAAETSVQDNGGIRTPQPHLNSRRGHGGTLHLARTQHNSSGVYRSLR